MAMKQLDEYMDTRTIFFTDSQNRADILDRMMEMSYSAGKVNDLEAFTRAIHERESIMSTGIGLGVAVPHAKIPSIDEFFIAVGILRNPVDWQAIDDRPVSIVFLIGGPDNRQKDYLRILSKLVLFTKNENRRKALIEAETAEEVVSHFRPGK